MVILRDVGPPFARGIDLMVQSRRNPGLLTLFINQVPPGRRIVHGRGVRCPQDEHEAWTFDLDAMKDEQTKAADAFPPWASGEISVEPTAGGGMWRFDITAEMLE
jgi:hypothetical protein